MLEQIAASGESLARFLLIKVNVAWKTHSAGADVAGICGIFTATLLSYREILSFQKAIHGSRCQLFICL